MLINPFCGSGAANYRCQTGSLIFLQFSICIYCSDIKFCPQPLISTTVTRGPANFINLSAIIVELRLAEHGTKFRRVASEFGNHNFAQHVLIHYCTFCEIFIKIWDGRAGSICWIDTEWLVCHICDPDTSLVKHLPPMNTMIGVESHST